MSRRKSTSPRFTVSPSFTMISEMTPLALGASCASACGKRVPVARASPAVPPSPPAGAMGWIWGSAGGGGADGPVAGGSSAPPPSRWQAAASASIMNRANFCMVTSR